MLYTRKAAAYLVALTLTLLFTTSEADFDIKKGKEAVNILLNHLTSIVLEHQTKDLNDLIRLQDVLIKVMGFPTYLEELAQDEQYFWTMLIRIDSYYKQFVRGKYEVKNEDLIPMKVDNHGFTPAFGIMAVLLLLGDFLRLVFEKKCTNLSSLNEIAGSIMNDQTELYQYVLLATDKFADDIKKEINEYKRSIQGALSIDLQDVVLSKIQEKCEKQPGEGTSQQGGGEDFQ